MQDNPWAEEEEQYIIWNSALGVRDFVTVGRIELNAGIREAWLEAPYDMAGPFSMDTLETVGLISFAACVVMSRSRWQEDQARLRRESYDRRLESEQAFFEELNRFNKRKQQRSEAFAHYSEQEHRERLCLPAKGVLEPSQIKAAYRKLAMTAHPDVGGSHELFVQITESRDILLECCS